MSFYRTQITVTVLSDRPLPMAWRDDLETIAYQIDQGECVGVITDDGGEELTAAQMATALIEAGSEPGFFRIGEDGNDDY